MKQNEIKELEKKENDNIFDVLKKDEQMKSSNVLLKILGRQGIFLR